MSVSAFLKKGDSSGYKNGLREGLLKVAIKIGNQAKALAPVDTGLLRNSIEAQSTGDEEARVGTNTEYAQHVEFGTKSQSAQPFLRPAVYIAANPGTASAVAEKLNIEMRKTLKNKRTKKL